VTDPRAYHGGLANDILGHALAVFCIELASTALMSDMSGSNSCRQLSKTVKETLRKVGPNDRGFFFLRRKNEAFQEGNWTENITDNYGHRQISEYGK
jgi:hypothetical protein